jgi:hypothetical protein
MQARISLLLAALCMLSYPRCSENLQVSNLTRYELVVTGHEGFKKAEVTGGGLPLTAVDTRTLEVKVRWVRSLLDVRMTAGAQHAHTRCQLLKVQWSPTAGPTWSVHCGGATGRLRSHWGI